MNGERTAAELVILGSGTSHGVPMLGCECDVCQSTHPLNQRLRSGALVRTGTGNFLIDTPPELRLQLLRERVSQVQAVLYTHSHADHIFGLDDLRTFGHRQGADIPLYCDAGVEQQLRQSFAYAFDRRLPATHSGAFPKLKCVPLEQLPSTLLGVRVQPVPVLHGALPISAFRLGDVGYCTDCSHIPDSSWPLWAGVRVLVIGALRHELHPTHFNVEQALAVIERLQPERAFLTHISHALDHVTTEAALPPHVRLAYDGLRIPIYA